MDFFEPLPASARRKPRGRRKRRESSSERPTLLVPGYLGRNLVLAASDQRAVVVHGIACYPTGFAFQLQTVNRYVPDLEDDSAFDEFPTYYGHRVNEMPEKVLRFGVEYSNGKRATNLDTYHFAGRNAAKETGPHLQFGSGGAAEVTGATTSGFGRCRRRVRSSSRASGLRTGSQRLAGR